LIFYQFGDVERWGGVNTVLYTTN